MTDEEAELFDPSCKRWEQLWGICPGPLYIENTLQWRPEDSEGRLVWREDSKGRLGVSIK